MAFISPRMLLRIWNVGQDPYDHEQLADNFLKLDQHDHSQGRGTLIGSDGIAPGAITAQHLAAGAVSTTIQQGSVTGDQLDPTARVPVGTVIDWWRPDASVPLPAGFEVCDGHSVSDHDFPVTGAVSVPDLRNCFILGARDGADGLNATGGDGAVDAPGIGGSGGTQSVTLNAAQTGVPAHSHTVTDPGHAHVIQAAFQTNAVAPGGGVYGGVTANSGTTLGVSQGALTGITVAAHPGTAATAHTNLPKYFGLLKLVKVKV